MLTLQAPAPPASPPPDLPRVVIGGVTLPGVGLERSELRAQRRQLTDQRQALVIEKSGMEAQLKSTRDGSAERATLDARIGSTDAQIATIDGMLAATDAQLALGGTQSVITVPSSHYQERVLPRDLFILSCLFTLVVFLPLSMAIARRIWRRGANAPAALPSNLAERLERMEMSIDSSAIEIERIGEGQRYLTKLLSERKAEMIDLPR